MPRKPSVPARTIQEYRDTHDAAFEARIQAMKDRYPVTQKDQLVAGVRTRTFIPRDGVPDPDHVLTNIHGGGFIGCEGACSQLESIPMAAVGRYKVVSVLYRMAPEAVFPAGAEDVSKVYLELLKTYKPQDIGIFGCSAGGQLTAQTTAYMLSKNIPRPGALGVFGAGAGRIKGGDSGTLAAAIDGGSAPATLAGDTKPIRDYFEGTDINGPIASPVKHLDVLAKFPPTLFLTSTRAADLSPAIYGHSQMVKAGVPGDLLVQDGLATASNIARTCRNRAIRIRLS